MAAGAPVVPPLGTWLAGRWPAPVGGRCRSGRLGPARPLAGGAGGRLGRAVTSSRCAVAGHSGRLSSSGRSGGGRDRSLAAAARRSGWPGYRPAAPGAAALASLRLRRPVRGDAAGCAPASGPAPAEIFLRPRSGCRSVARFRAFGQSLPSGSRAQPTSPARSAPRGNCSYALCGAVSATLAFPASRRVANTCPCAAPRRSGRGASATVQALGAACRRQCAGLRGGSIGAERPLSQPRHHCGRRRLQGRASGGARPGCLRVVRQVSCAEQPFEVSHTPIVRPQWHAGLVPA